jgi:protein-tyrosine phosphatase
MLLKLLEKAQFLKVKYIVFEVLFVCTGNTCRSPMAEALLQNQLSFSKRKKYSISSAGTNATGSSHASILATEAMQAINIDISGHKSRQLTNEMVDRADLILALSETHAESVRGSYPKTEGKVFLLSDYSGMNKGSSISDPFGSDLDTYITTRDEISAHTSLIAAKM